nr:hypothetical protein [uncultured Acetobacter sp.]
MSTSQALIENRRLRVLQSLHEVGDGRMGEPVLLRVLRLEGCPTDFDVLRADLDWLEHQSCIRIEKLPTETPGDVVWVAVLTATGSRVVDGVQRINGVARSPIR